ncbi:protein ABHD1 isoform X2 [Alligator mississippiensis]|uniref:protein ABHD1 isoform X2 n=1 Tax=Alligator mississippiensis TaxID=8496 RepID=UPI0028780E3D|nr:protein ABHD1 isoform X2 [Alligator mississippiensis]
MLGETMFGVPPLLLPCGAGLGPWLWALVLGAGTAWLGWSWARALKRPLLVAAPLLRAFLERHCPIVCETFYPTPWCFEGRLQTLLRHILLSEPPVLYRSELLHVADGGQLLLDWADNPGSRRYPDPSTRPTLLLLPGATNNSEASYILHLVHGLLQVGYRCVVLNCRGCKGDELLTPRAFSVANTEDLETTIAHIRAQLPQAPLLAMGFSMGGTLLLHHLARTGHAAGLEAAVAMSPVWDYGEFLNLLEQSLPDVVFRVPLVYFVRRLVKSPGTDPRRNLLVTWQHCRQPGAAAARGCWMLRSWRRCCALSISASAQQRLLSIFTEGSNFVLKNFTDGHI